MRPIDADALIEKCGDWYVEEGTESGFIGTLKNLLATEPTVQPEPQWIPVSERLPRDGSWNIFTDGKNISVERYKADAIDHFFPNGRWFEFEDVIAWMPLPKPFEGGTE